ncbi:hypothetical protein AHF37_05766 [Paragonimus kellicotti]|nr:hypothetical protein AHF37_05766 [Paragonimus kellicotti]
MLLSKLSKIGKKDQPSDLPKYAEQLEHTVEDVRRLAADLNKGLQQYVLFAKRNKKIPEQQFASVLKDSIDKLGSEGSVFLTALQETSEVSSSLASLRRDFEIKVDKHVYDPLNRLTDDVCASIGKQRRNLNKATNEARSAREQLQKAASQVTIAGAGTTVNLDWQTYATNQPSVATDALARLSQAQNQLDEKDRDVSLCKAEGALFPDFSSPYINNRMTKASRKDPTVRGVEGWKCSTPPRSASSGGRALSPARLSMCADLPPLVNVCRWCVGQCQLHFLHALAHTTWQSTVEGRRVGPLDIPHTLRDQLSRALSATHPLLGVRVLEQNNFVPVGCQIYGVSLTNPGVPMLWLKALMGMWQRSRGSVNNLCARSAVLSSSMVDAARGVSDDLCMCHVAHSPDLGSDVSTRVDEYI